MAIKNTPSSYKCSACCELGHNARTCPTRGDRTPTKAQILAAEREARKAARLLAKAAKEAEKAAKASAREIAKAERAAAKIAKAAIKATAKPAKAPKASAKSPPAVPVVTVSAEIADAFGMAGLPGVVIADEEPIVEASGDEEIVVTEAGFADFDYGKGCGEELANMSADDFLRYVEAKYPDLTPARL